MMSAIVTVDPRANRRIDLISPVQTCLTAVNLPAETARAREKFLLPGPFGGHYLTVRTSAEVIRRQLFADSPSSTAPATACIEVRRSIAVRWIQRKASGSVIFWCVISRPLARSMILRASSR